MHTNTPPPKSDDYDVLADEGDDTTKMDSYESEESSVEGYNEGETQADVRRSTRLMVKKNI